MPHVTHEDGLGMRLAREVAVSVPSSKHAESFVVIRVKFGQVAHLSNQSLHVVLRVAIHKEVVLGSWTLEVGVGS